MRNITPNIARNTSIMPPVPVLNAGLRKYAHVEHRLVGVQLPEHEQREHDDARSRTRRASPALAQPLSGASMSPYTSDEMPTIESTAPTGSSARLFGVRRLRHEEARRGTSATRMIGTLTRNTEPNQKCPSSQPLSDRADRARGAGDAGPDRDRLGPLVRGEHVHEDRQRRRHDERRARRP